MSPEQLKKRTKAFAIQSILFVKDLPPEDVAMTLGRQFMRAATSVGANYRAVCRARSSVDMIAKLKIVEEEADEAAYWLEIFEETGYAHPSLKPLLIEANEIVSIMVASIKTLRSREDADSRAVHRSGNRQSSIVNRQF